MPCFRYFVSQSRCSLEPFLMLAICVERRLSNRLVCRTQRAERKLNFLCHKSRVQSISNLSLNLITEFQFPSDSWQTSEMPVKEGLVMDKKLRNTCCLRNDGRVEEKEEFIDYILSFYQLNRFPALLLWYITLILICWAKTMSHSVCHFLDIWSSLSQTFWSSWSNIPYSYHHFTKILCPNNTLNDRLIDRQTNRGIKNQEITCLSIIEWLPLQHIMSWGA